MFEGGQGTWNAKALMGTGMAEMPGAAAQVLPSWCTCAREGAGKGRMEERGYGQVRSTEPYCRQHCSRQQQRGPAARRALLGEPGAPRPGSVLTHVGAGWGQPRAHSCRPALPAAGSSERKELLSGAHADGEEQSVLDGSRRSAQAELCRVPEPERCGQQGPWLQHSSHYQNL